MDDEKSYNELIERYYAVYCTIMTELNKKPEDTDITLWQIVVDEAFHENISQAQLQDADGRPIPIPEYRCDSDINPEMIEKIDKEYWGDVLGKDIALLIEMDVEQCGDYSWY